MAILYKANETDFNHLGLGPLNDAVSVLVTEERNGVFELEMKYPEYGARFEELKLDRIIKADSGYELKNQRFKIIRISKPLDGIVTVYGEHVSYLTQDLALKPIVNFNGNAQAALNTWKNSIVDTNPFMVASDIMTDGKGSWKIDKVENPRRALGGVAGSMLDIYGGEYKFDNYSIRLMAQRGINSGALIAYGRNLVDLEQEETINETYTSVYPYSVYQDENNKEVLLTLPEYFIDSDHVNNFARRKILSVDFSEDEIKTVESLRSATKSYIKANNVGIPKVNLRIKYIDLAKTLDYQGMKAEQVNLCDNVMVYFEKFDINTTAKVIKTVWDDILKQYDSVEIGEARSSLSQSIGATVDGKLETVVQRLNTIQFTADGKNVIHRGPEEPPPGNIGDMWYEPDGDFEVMHQWDGTIWKVIFNTRDLDEMKRTVAAAIKQADIDRAKAEQDFETAKSEAKAYTELKANEFNGQLEIVRADVADTVIKANDAVAKANQSIADVGFMQIDLNTTKQNAIDALTKAQTATDNLNTLSFNVDELTKTVSFKAEKTTVDAVTKQVNQHELSIAANAREIDLRMTSTQVDSLVTSKGYVNQAQLTATSEKWNLSLTQVSADLDNSKIGSRNLLIRKNEKVGYLAGNGSIVTSATASRTMFIKIKVTPGEVLTFTKGASGTDPYWRWDLYNSSGTYVNRVTNDKNLFQWTVPAFVSEIQVSYPNVNEIMIERGSAATVYRPAPEDTPTLEQFTTIDATVKGLQTTVGNKADETKVTQLANQWTQTTALVNGHTGQISNLGEQINLRVTSSQVSEAILADKTIIDTRNDNQIPNWYFEQYPKRTVEEFKTRSILGIPGTAVFGQLTTTVPWNNNAALGVVITQTFRSSDGVFQRRGSADGTFWTEWDQVSENGKLISQINVQSGNILIQTGKLYLDTTSTHMTTAYVNDLKAKSLEAVYAEIGTLQTKILTADVITSTMIKSDTALIAKFFATDANVSILTAKAAFINSVKAIDITADKVTGGTFNAALMNVVGLNAGSITTGTLKGANMALNLNTGTYESTQYYKNEVDTQIKSAGIDISNGSILNYSYLEPQRAQLSSGSLSLQIVSGNDPRSAKKTKDISLTGVGISFSSYDSQERITRSRLLEAISEGLVIRATAGTGTDLNASLHLNGGVSYVQFNNRAGTVNNGRIQMTSDSATIQIPNGAFLAIRDRNNLQAGISVNYVTTEHNTGYTIQMAGDSIKTPRDGNRNIYIAPNGTGSVVSGESNGTRYNMVASDFVKQSSRSTKTNIIPLESGLDNIRQLKPVSYNKIDKLNQGIFEIEKGFIAEDSLMVATVDGKGIYDSHITAYLVKAVQELDVRTMSETDLLKEKVRILEEKIQKLESAA